MLRKLRHRALLSASFRAMVIGTIAEIHLIDCQKRQVKSRVEHYTTRAGS